MNWPIFRTDAWIATDVGRIVFGYAVPALHRYRPAGPSDHYETDADRRMATMSRYGFRAWMADPVLKTAGRLLRLRIVSDSEASDIRVGVGNLTAERSYSINMLRQYRDGFGDVPDRSRHPLQVLYKMEYTVVVFIDVFFRRTSEIDKNLPSGNIHYGYKDFYERRRFLSARSKSAIRSLSTIRFVVDGRTVVVENLPDIDDFVPYVELPSGSATIDDDAASV